MTAAATGEEIVGRGLSEGKYLFAQWFMRLGQAAENGELAAYVFVMGSLAEILRAFDLHIVFPEINSLQTAVKKVSGDFLSVAEDYGYSPDVCGYVKADVAMQLQDGHHPMGRIPRPSIAVLTNACNTYLKWAEIWDRFYHIPLVTVDVPASRSEAASGQLDDAALETDRRFVEQQLRELIAQLEQLTGRPLDMDRFRQVLRDTNRMTRSWARILDLNRRTPSVFNALMDGTVYLGVANALRGTPEGALYFERLVEEMEYKAAHGIGAIPDEQHRLIFVGVPCYPIFRRFHELFAEWGGSFVSSTYLWFAAGGMNLGFEYDLDNPIESLAEGVLRSVRAATDAMMFHDRALLEAIDLFHADGIVYHPVKSCRTVSTGLADSRRVVLQRRDVQCLYIESDMMDQRVVSEAQLKNRIDAFFEGLNSRRLRMRAQEAPAADADASATRVPA
jgi:benzoyl-CoA reductase subunit B